MPKFNKWLAKRRVSIVQFAHNTINRAGGLAYQDSPKMSLYRQVATSLWSGDGYYEKQAEWFHRFQENVSRVVAEDSRFPFALAAYARDKNGLALRTSPIALYVEAATHKETKGTGYIRKYAPRILLRADEPAEAIAYFKQFHKGVIPHGLLRGIADVLKGYDEYQLGKYKKTGAVSIRDVLRLARPKPETEEEENLWGKVVNNELETPYTWEVELSKCTTNQEKHDKWNELIHSGRLGLFALVRNIRNIVQYYADVEEALGQITEERVKGSGILPFQWYKAYKALVASVGDDMASPMKKALTWSLSDIPKLPGITLVVSDNSGSMSTTYSTRGLSHAEIANLMGAMALYCCEDGIAATFGDHFALADTHPSKDLFSNKAQIDSCGARTGNATNAWKIFEFLIRNKIYVDRLILFSDMQCYDSGAHFSNRVFFSHSLSTELDAYLQLNPNMKVYSINLASQDNSCQFAPTQPVIELAGWSDSILQFINAMETGESIIGFIEQKY